MALPNLIIAGVNKAGTTSLFSYLGQHPAVGTSAVKETCYFLPPRYGRAIEPLDVYEAQFAHCGDRPVRVESTPGYFAGGDPVARAIHDTLPHDVKLVLIFRDPVSRLQSFFQFKKSTLELPADMSLAQYVQRCRSFDPQEIRRQENNAYFGIAGGEYAAYLPTWLDLFGRQRIHVTFFEHLRDRPRDVLRELFTFAGLDAGFADRVDLTIENRTTNFRFAGLQRAALRLNERGERFWRSHPRLKRSLRRAYYALNGRAFDVEADDATLADLRGYFEPWNARFADQLRAAGYTGLPGWLSDPGAAARSRSAGASVAGSAAVSDRP